MIEAASPTPLHQDVVFKVLTILRRYLLGKAGAAGAEFALSDLLRLRPDVSALLAEKAARLDRNRIPIPGAPDLANEVISPTERLSESHEKVRAYLRNGTQEVWQIFPKSRTAEVHRRNSSIILDPSQTVTSDLLPGFEVAVSSFFE